MTAGAIALNVMRTGPAPLSPSLAMAAGTADIYAEMQTDIPLDERWRHIVLHATGAEGSDLLKRVHFVVEADGTVKATALWKAQQPAQHVRSLAHNYNADSIGIALRGEFSQKPPTKAQLLALVRVVADLKELCNISTSRVYSYRPDLNTSGPGSPGREFPMREFTRLLDEQ